MAQEDIRYIALSGYAQSGKDTVGSILVRNHGYVRRGFADPMREMAEDINPVVWSGNTGALRLTEVLETGGWEGAKEIPEVRRFLQRLGVSARNFIHEDVWVDMAVKPAAAYRTVFTDCRFPNEAIAIKAIGGEVWRIERAGCGPVNDHESEHALKGWLYDKVLYNNGSVEDLEKEVSRCLSMTTTTTTSTATTSPTPWDQMVLPLEM